MELVIDGVTHYFDPSENYEWIRKTVQETINDCVKLWIKH